MEKIILAYCRDNADLAESIDDRLGLIGIPFEHVTNRPGTMPGQFAAWVQSSSAPVILLITDNFLKNKNCMSSALEMVKGLIRHNRLLTVVADGWQKNGGAKLIGTQVETRFERVVDSIKYLNYWQNSYIDLSNTVDGSETADYQVLKSISTEIPDLLNVLRDHGFCAYSDFSENNFELFFKKFGIEEWHEQFANMMNVEGVHIQATKHTSLENPIPQSAHSEKKPAEIEAPTVQEKIDPELEKNRKNGELTELNNGRYERRQVISENEFFEMDSMLDELVEEENLENSLDSAIEKAVDESIKEFESEEDVSPKETPQEEPQSPALPEPKQKEIQQNAEQDAAYWFDKNETEKGLRILEMATELNPKDNELRLSYAKALLKEQGNHESAHLELEKLMANGFFNAEAYNLMGNIAYAKEDYILAKNCWDKVSQLDPGFSGIFAKLGDLSANHFRGFKQKAATYYEKSVEQNPNDAQTLYKHGAVLLEHLNKPKKAARFLLQALNIDPNNARAWSDLAIAYHNLGDEKRADAAYRKSVSLNPEMQSETGDALFLLHRVEVKESKKARFTILITGATSGIGRATAQLFAEHGHRIILTGRRLERLQDLKSAFKKKYEKADCHILNFDVRDRVSTSEVLNSLPEDWRNIDILLNNAGLAKGFDPIHEGSFEHWDTMIDTNIKGLLNVTRLVAPWMVARKQGHIINIGSSAGKEAYGKGAVYCATKFGVDALTKAMRIDLHQHNIRVSQVSPGHVEETEFAITRFDGDAEKAKIYEDFQPLKSSDVAESIYFIATRPAHVNIQDIYLFGTQQANATTINRSGRK